MLFLDREAILKITSKRQIKNHIFIDGNLDIIFQTQIVLLFK